MKNVIAVLMLSIILTGCNTVKQAQIVPGMSSQEVQLAWNAPQKIENNKNSCCKQPGEEVWYYFHTQYQHPKQAKYVLFNNGIVQDVHVWKR